MWNTDEPSPNAPLTDSMIADAQAALGVQFPDSYLDALRVKNGGSIAAHLIRLPDQDIPAHLKHYVDQGYIRVRGINGIGSSDASVLEASYLVAEWGLPEGLVLLDGDGHWWIAFDYRETPKDPPVVFIDSDTADTLQLADNFSEFFRSLVRKEDVYDADGNVVG